MSKYYVRVNGVGNAWPVPLGMDHPFYDPKIPEQLANVSFSLIKTSGGNPDSDNIDWEVLIDAGHGIVQYLIRNGNRLPDAVILTHAHLDHTLSLDWIIQSYHRHHKKEKRFLRMINFNSKGEIEKDYVIDASLFAIFEFEVFEANDPLVKSTMEQVIDKLWIKTEVGGVARYQNDYYHQISKDLEKVPGNPWFICTLWLSEYYISLAKMSSPTEYDEYLNKATELLEWVSNRALTSGILAEQVHPYSNKPLSVSPLTWSHATFILTVIEYLEAYSHLKTCSSCNQPLYFHKTP